MANDGGSCSEADLASATVTRPDTMNGARPSYCPTCYQRVNCSICDKPCLHANLVFDYCVTCQTLRGEILRPPRRANRWASWFAGPDDSSDDDFVPHSLSMHPPFSEGSRTCQCCQRFYCYLPGANHSQFCPLHDHHCDGKLFCSRCDVTFCPDESRLVETNTICSFCIHHVAIEAELAVRTQIHNASEPGDCSESFLSGLSRLSSEGPYSDMPELSEPTVAGHVSPLLNSQSQHCMARPFLNNLSHNLPDE